MEWRNSQQGEPEQDEVDGDSQDQYGCDHGGLFVSGLQGGECPFPGHSRSSHSIRELSRGVRFGYDSHWRLSFERRKAVFGTHDLLLFILSGLLLNISPGPARRHAATERYFDFAWFCP